MDDTRMCRLGILADVRRECSVRHIFVEIDM